MQIGKINIIQNIAFKSNFIKPKKLPYDCFEKNNNTLEINEKTQVPMHHDISGYNSSIRDDLEEFGTSRRIDKIDKAFSLLPPLEKDIIVYRGRTEGFIKRFNRDFEIIENAKIGDIIIPDTSYSYTALNLDTAKHFMSSWNKEVKSMLYIIKIPKGAKVSRNMEHSGEVIMPRSAQYRLISKEKNDNTLIVKMEYILPD